LLTHPTLDQLHHLGLHGMAKAFIDIEAGGEAASLGHAEWLALLLEREASLRRDKRLSKRLHYAKLRQQAASRTSTIAPRAASTAPCWPHWSKAAGSTTTPTC
jgi:IstB-like ATP binding protein